MQQKVLAPFFDFKSAVIKILCGSVKPHKLYRAKLEACLKLTRLWEQCQFRDGKVIRGRGTEKFMQGKMSGKNACKEEAKGKKNEKGKSLLMLPFKRA